MDRLSWLTSVLDPEQGVVRLTMLVATAALLVQALCVPEAFADRQRLLAAVVLAALVPVALAVAAIVTLALALAVLVAVLAYEVLRFAELRERLRHAEPPAAQHG